MTVNRVDSLTSSSQVQDIEVKSEHNPNPAKPLIWMNSPKPSPEQLQRNLSDAGLRSRSTLSGARLRDQLSAAAPVKTDGGEIAGLSNGRFAGEPSLEGVLTGGTLPRKSEGV